MVQAWWKGRRQCAFLKQLRAAAVLIQAQQRMLVARACYLQKKHAVVLIQRHMRGWSVRRQVAEQNVAATCIQAGAVLIKQHPSMFSSAGFISPILYMMLLRMHPYCPW